MVQTMPQIFLTGASGYVGGEVLHQLSTSPQLKNIKVACLNRDASKAEQIRKAHPKAVVVQGELDDTDLIQQEAEKADVVLHLASTKHIASAKAIIAGLNSSKRRRAIIPTCIQMSGATLYASQEIAEHSYGQPSSESWNDLRDTEAILRTIRSIPSRVVEQTMIQQDPFRVKTALIVGPLIYGEGRGPCHTRSIQAPELARATIELGHGIRLLKGENAWSNVHVADLASLVVALVEAALQDKEVKWNQAGVYHPASGVMKFKDLDALVAEAAVEQGAIENADLVEIDAKEAERLSPGMSVFWGTNAVIEAQRASEALGWQPTGPSLAEHVPALVKNELERGRRGK